MTAAGVSDILGRGLERCLALRWNQASSAKARTCQSSVGYIGTVVHVRVAGLYLIEDLICGTLATEVGHHGCTQSVEFQTPISSSVSSKSETTTHY